MRPATLLPLTLLAGCFIVIDRRGDDLVDDEHDRPGHHGRPGETDVDDTGVVDTGAAETDTPVPACGDEVVQDLLAALAAGQKASCGHAFAGFAATNDADEELVLQVYVRTAGDDGPSTPYEVGQVFSADLASADPADGWARLRYGTSLFDEVCNDVVGGDTRTFHRWDGVSGTITVEVTDAQDEVQPWGEALFQADVGVQDLVPEDADGERCSVPDATWTDLWLGWLPG